MLGPSPDVLEDLAEASEPFRTLAGDNSDVASSVLRAGMDGFLNNPLTEPRGFTGRAAKVLEPYLDTEIVGPFSGLVGRGPREADKEARDDTLFSVGRGASFGMVLVGVVVLEP